MNVQTKERTQTGFVAEKTLSKPPLYQVIFCQDDFIPMDFITDVLTNIFNMDELHANQVMLEIQHLGQAICGIYVRQVAEMKVSEVLSFASANGYAVRCFFEVAL